MRHLVKQQWFNSINVSKVFKNHGKKAQSGHLSTSLIKYQQRQCLGAVTSTFNSITNGSKHTNTY